MTRVAAVDCGTNSIRLLIAEPGPDGRLIDVDRRMHIVRLGEGVDATGRLAPAAIERTRVALAEYAEAMVAAGVEKVRMAATSATRDAANKEEFFAMTAEELGKVAEGARAEVITGDEEARLSFAGALTDLDTGDKPVLVVDLGGGSTELVLGHGREVTAAHSADIGCVRVTERALGDDDPPTTAEIAAAEEFIAERLDKALAAVPVAGATALVGVAGTMTTLGALALGLDSYDPDKIHRSAIPIPEFEKVCADVAGLDHAQRAALGPMHPKRVDVIGGGALVARAVTRAVAAAAGIDEIIISERDILDGLVLSLT